MQNISSKLHELVVLVSNKHSELLKKQGILEGKETNILTREDAVAKKETELHTREFKVSSIEDVAKFRLENMEIAKKIEVDRQILSSDQDKFRKLVSEKTALIESQNNEIEVEKKALNQLREELEKQKETYKQEVLKKLVK